MHKKANFDHGLFGSLDYLQEHIYRKIFVPFKSIYDE